MRGALMGRGEILSPRSLWAVLVVMAAALMAGCGIGLMEPKPVAISGDGGFDVSATDVETEDGVGNARVRVEWTEDRSIYYEAFTDPAGSAQIRYLRRGDEEVPLIQGQKYTVTVSSSDYKSNIRDYKYEGALQEVGVGLVKFQDNQRVPDAPLPPSPDMAEDPYFRTGPPIP